MTVPWIRVKPCESTAVLMACNCEELNLLAMISLNLSVMSGISTGLGTAGARSTRELKPEGGGGGGGVDGSNVGTKVDVDSASATASTILWPTSPTAPTPPSSSSFSSSCEMIWNRRGN